jgi:hypothetical protein
MDTLDFDEDYKVLDAITWDDAVDTLNLLNDDKIDDDDSSLDGDAAEETLKTLIKDLRELQPIETTPGGPTMQSTEISISGQSGDATICLSWESLKNWDLDCVHEEKSLPDPESLQSKDVTIIIDTNSS